MLPHVLDNMNMAIPIVIAQHPNAILVNIYPCDRSVPKPIDVELVRIEDLSMVDEKFDERADVCAMRDDKNIERRFGVELGESWDYCASPPVYDSFREAMK